VLRDLLSRGGPHGVGVDPDYRFTLANERTFLAWIRTALALVAGGLGVLHLLPDQPGSEILGLVVLGLAFIVAAGSYRRWFLSEQAIRQDRPLPPSRLPQFVAGMIALLALVAAVLFIVGGP
jgi:putative membrane protein